MNAKKNYNVLIFFILAIIAFLLSQDILLAYDPKDYSWDGDPTLRVAKISFPEGSVWRSDLENAIGRWNGMVGMWLEYDYIFVDDTSYSSGDDKNTVGFVAGSDIDNKWGRTRTRYDCDEIEETDVLFNADLVYNTGVQDERVRDTSAPAFRKVSVHELGHALGLAHYCNELAQMAQGFTGHIWYGDSATYRHHPTPDDCEGARYQYPFSNSEVDASLMNFEMNGSCGSQIWRNNSTVTLVSPGGSVNVEYTVTNPSNTGINFSLGVYVSTNDFISQFDTYIGGFSYFLPPHYAWERDKTFTIPVSVAPGTYFIGAIVDVENSLAENRESNNRLVFPGKWQVQ
ncbi:matrixin family metalloprotease [bacterium]|nr:matrixin family metalloprotease [bacterium]